MNNKIAVLYGSARRSRQGIKAARFITKKLEERGYEVELVDSEHYSLPMLDRMYKEFDPGEAPEPMATVAGILEDADGFVVVSAEYNHSVPAALKNLLDHYQSEYLYKPSAIVTYSAGPFGGVRALINLRALLAELGTPTIPSAYPVPAIRDAFDDEGNALKSSHDERVGKFLDEFDWYVAALKCQRGKEPDACDVPTQQQLCRG